MNTNISMGDRVDPEGVSYRRAASDTVNWDFFFFISSKARWAWDEGGPVVKC